MPVTAPAPRPMRSFRLPQNRPNALLTLSVVAALMLAPALSFAQTEPATGPALAAPEVPSTAPATAPTMLIPPPSTAPAPGPLSRSHPSTPAAPAAEIANVSQPFVGRVMADRVNIRSGPGGAYYEIGQVSKGDTVEVVGSRLGWYQILPPNGTFCMVAKDLVEADPTGDSGTVKADYVNVRAGTAVNKNREPSAVLAVVRKGTKLTILGSTDKYCEVAPPEKAYVYISPQFVRADASAEYAVPELKLPAGATGPSKTTVTAPTTLPTATVEITPPTPAESGAAGENVPTTNPSPSAEAVPTETVVVPPQPTTAYSADAYARFSELNKRYQAELQKPLLQRDIEGLLRDYKALAETPSLPPSVQQGTEPRISALEKLAAIQRMAKENATLTSALAEQQRALQEQYSAAQKAIQDYEQSGPYVAQGRLQTSSAVPGAYALVAPDTGRVVAYVDPQSDVDISSLLGKYIGVRGTSHQAEGSAVTVIHVNNATLLPTPSPNK